MNMFTKKFSRIACGILAVFLLTVGLSGCKEEQAPEQTEAAAQTQEQTQAPELQEETLPPVQVVMPEYEFTYSGEMAELITTEELTEENGLRFMIQLSTEKIPLFTLLWNQTQGDVVQMMKNEAGEQIPVAFMMETAPEELSEADNATFCLAQDVVNDIIASIKVK